MPEDKKDLKKRLEVAAGNPLLAKVRQLSIVGEILAKAWDWVLLKPWRRIPLLVLIPCAIAFFFWAKFFFSVESQLIQDAGDVSNMEDITFSQPIELSLSEDTKAFLLKLKR